MYDRILVATDGSDRTRAAAAHALGLAERFGASVHALYVVDIRALSFDDEDFVGNDAIVDSLTDRGRRATEEIARRAEALGLDAESAVVQGTPSREIRAYATERDVDLVALGTRGQSGLARYMLGSVAESVLRKATQPVLTARAAVAERGTTYEKILLPVDGGKHSRRVAEHAFDIAAQYDATVHALSVIDSALVRSPDLLGALERESEAAIQAVKRRGRERDVDVVTSLWRGTPSDCISTYATDVNVDLITMGAHERRGLDRFLTQSVAERVVRTAPAPVLTLRRSDEE